MAEQINWPDLPEDGYLTDRAATTEDVDAGIAVFALKIDDEYVGKPVEMPIPQYAVRLDANTGEEEPVLAIQAETNGEITAIGYKRVIDGEFGVSLIDEFRFLGQYKP